MKTILVVEDQPITRMGHCMLISDEIGCTVLEAGNGLDALEIMRSHTIDLILSNLKMPLMDGSALYHLLRRGPSWTTLPIILYSGGNWERELAQLTRQDPFLDHWPHPFDFETLLRLLRERGFQPAEPPTAESPGAD